MTAWTHHDLQRDLRGWLLQRRPRPMVATEIALDGSWGSAGRLDAVAALVLSGYTGVTIDGYEVKAQRSDWLRDLAAEKWSRYTTQLHRLYLAVPAGWRVVQHLDEVPKAMGVLLRDDRGWTVARKPQKLDGPRDVNGALMRLCRRLAEEATGGGPETRLERMRRYAEVQEDAQLAQFLSERFRKADTDLRVRINGAEREVERLDTERRRLEAEVARLRQLPDVLADIEALMRLARSAVAPLSAYDPERSAERRDYARDVLHGLAARLDAERRIV